jgi:hypothetical protein
MSYEVKIELRNGELPLNLGDRWWLDSTGSVVPPVVKKATPACKWLGFDFSD